MPTRTLFRRAVLLAEQLVQHVYLDEYQRECESPDQWRHSADDLPALPAAYAGEFLAPYLDEQGQNQSRTEGCDHSFELTHTDTDDLGYDLQDLVLLCTFRDP